MSSEIKITIAGKDVRPDTVPLPDLLDILQKMHSVIVATAQDSGVKKDDIKISLTGVSGGSDTLTLTVDDKTLRHAQRVVDAVKTKNAALIPRRARAGLYDVWKKASAKSWHVKIQRGTNGSVESSATIDPNKSPFSNTVTSGDTSLLAYIVRVGGENPSTANLRIAGHQKVTATIKSRDVAEQLGGYLFQYVELQGKATWNTEDWSIHSFVINSIGSYCEKNSNPAGALEELAQTSSGIWDTVDPDDFLREIRSE